MAQAPRYNRNDVRQIEITSPLPLLDRAGQLSQAGWARQPYWQFAAAAIRQAPAQLRQWDFFTVMDDRVAVSLTMANLGFGGFCAAELLDFAAGPRHHVNIRPFRFPRHLTLSTAPRGEARWQAGRNIIHFRPESDDVVLTFRIVKALVLPDIQGEVRLRWPKSHQGLSCVFPFPEQAGGFFYETKSPGIPATGWVAVAGKRHTFANDKTFAVLDWGRGVWPRQVFWRWAAVSTRLADGRNVGINLGNGFGDTSHGSENAVVVDGILHKLGKVEWQLDRGDYLKPWRMTADDERFAMTFTPVYDQHSNANLWIKKFAAHRVWGHYDGKLTLDDGRRIELPKTLGFAEEVWIKW